MPFNAIPLNTSTAGTVDVPGTGTSPPPPGPAPTPPVIAPPTPTPAAKKTIKGPVSGYTKVFRRIVRALKNDPIFRAVVPGTGLLSWEGTSADAQPLAPTTGKPLIRLTPQPQHGGWYSPDTQETTLAVTVEMAVAGYCVDDVNDLWDMLVTALRPGNATLVADLMADGAETGEILFSDPTYDHKRETQGSANWYATGQFKVTILRVVYP